MSITKDVGRQYPLIARVAFTFEDFVSGTIQAAVDIPGGAVVTGGAIVITTAFDSATSDTMTVGDVGDVETRYETSVDGSSAARSVLALDGVAYAAPAEIGIKWTGVGAAPAQGAGYLDVEYAIDGRAQEVQPA